MRLIKLSEVKHLTGLGRSTIYNFMKEGKFPQSVSLGGRAVAWVESEVMEWIVKKIAERDGQPPQFS
ncbi:AlpA family transcriptional regulator [Photobacterium sp. R1]